MAHIFLSYLEEDAPLAYNTQKQLEKAGFEVWVDPAKARYMDANWHHGVDNAIGASFAMVVILTPESLQSALVTYEWSFALGIGLTVIPVLFKEVQMPRRLLVLRCLDFSESRTWEDLNHLLNNAKETYDPLNVRISQEMKTIVDVETVKEHRLVMDSGAGRVAYAMENSVVTIGRDTTNNIVLDMPDISRHHVRIVHTLDGFSIEDLGSKNGTFLNGEPLTRVKLLQSADKIRLGEKLNMYYEVASKPN
ncbi:MAG: FHA domain-containing protein [Phototrophicales bacterium]|nr:FHA domain-containing protein [Phototrophicales bacterium]